ncbi:hypothetical protein D9756_009558 [Leucocoprinus leucothites]|uniref:Alcohol dehydrogenase-like C-terminal domain-containing protein n=1 Tax=Leucocoprinus leucothites TaxID=201217 RepID=A0A8H5CWR3_9AGAR|nr:hypothetical protein D9756_009558 [Leucoagaricus leucothites]
MAPVLGFLEPGKTTVYDDPQTIDLESVDLNGGFPVKTHYLSVDPYFRARMPRVQYWPTYPGAKQGDYIYGIFRKTTYTAWKEYSNAKKARPVESAVIQLAKMDGAKVIASAGSEEKVQFMKEIGADVVFNYKTANTNQILQKEGPIDIYWDNVGGDTLSAALDTASIGARFINLDQIFAKSLNLQGFIVTRLEPEYGEELYEIMPKVISEGKFIWREEIWEGLDKVGDAILAVQQGKNKAEMVVRVASE